MADKSAIEWTDATWNPIVGCSVLTPGCTNCYAMKMAARIERMHAGRTHYAGTTKIVNGNAIWTGKMAVAPETIVLQPLKWKRGRRIFVNSMGDLFHEKIPDESIHRVFAIMAMSPQHTFQVLTKRAERMRDYICSLAEKGWLPAHNKAFGIWIDTGRRGTHVPTWPLPNVWLGVSTERQKEADERIPLLLQTPAAVRFISAEPLLGPLDLKQYLDGHEEHGIDLSRLVGQRVGACIEWTPPLDWIICGGESGPSARPMHPQWAKALRDQCASADVPFFFKQWGSWEPHKVEVGGDLGGDVRAGRVRIVHPSARSNVEISEATGGRSTEPGSRYMRLANKKAAGRLLDGREYSQFPAAAKARAA